MPIKSFHDLLVYKKAYELSLLIHSRTLKFPQYEQYEIARQMRKASKSICANLAEGYSKSNASEIEFKRYIQISLGSSDEMLVWLDYSFSLNYIDEDEYNKFSESYKEISKMLQGLYKTWQ